MASYVDRRLSVGDKGSAREMEFNALYSDDLHEWFPRELSGFFMNLPLTTMSHVRNGSGCCGCFGVASGDYAREIELTALCSYDL